METVAKTKVKTAVAVKPACKAATAAAVEIAIYAEALPNLEMNGGQMAKIVAEARDLAAVVVIEDKEISLFLLVGIPQLYQPR